MASFTALMHPDYAEEAEDWKKYRLTFEGGREFIDEYMQKFSAREQDAEFTARKLISYCPAFAKSAVGEINNAIFQRMADVTRLGGSPSYQSAVIGHNGGVDLSGNSMTSFIGQEVLPELLSMRKVGIFVDMPPVSGPTVADVGNKRPYVYSYCIEDIYNWTTDKVTGQFTRLLLRECNYKNDPITGLPTLEYLHQYRFFALTPAGVAVTLYDDSGNVIEATRVLAGLTKIPFILLEIRESLLKDVASYQIALLNMASSDVNYSFRANFPIYTEQSDFRLDSPHLIPAQAGSRTPANTAGTTGTVSGESVPGTSTAATTAKVNELSLGVGRGRRYPKGVDRPGFIHPSAEPLLASIDKQERMKSEIRMLVHLSVSNLSQKMASAESKSYDERGLESGLSAVGLILERAERQIAEFWAAYESPVNPKPAVVTYPTSYSLETDGDRIEKAGKLSKLTATVNSKLFQKEMCKKITRTLLGNSLSLSDLLKIDSEIESTNAVICDPEILIQAMQEGALSAETFGNIMGFPQGEAEKAKREHEERLARIASSQMEGNAPPGTPLDPSPGTSSKDQKRGKDKRGDGRNLNKGGSSE